MGRVSRPAQSGRSIDQTLSPCSCVIRDSFWNSNRFCDRSYNSVIVVTTMKLKKQMRNVIGKRATRRIFAAAPWVGAALAVGAGTVMSRNGTLNAAVAKGRALLQPERGQEAGQVTIA